MKAFLRELAQAFLCLVRHNYEVYSNVQISNEFGERWNAYHLRCMRCGSMKKQSMK